MNRFKVTLLISLLTMAGMHSATINAAATSEPDLAELYAQYKSLLLGGENLISRDDIISHAHELRQTPNAHVANAFAQEQANELGMQLPEMKELIQAHATKYKETQHQYIARSLQMRIDELRKKATPIKPSALRLAKLATSKPAVVTGGIAAARAIEQAIKDLSTSRGTTHEELAALQQRTLNVVQQLEDSRYIIGKDRYDDLQSLLQETQNRIATRLSTLAPASMASAASKAALPAAQTEDEMLAAAMGITVAELAAMRAAEITAATSTPVSSSKRALPAATAPVSSGAGSAAGGPAAPAAAGTGLIAFVNLPQESSGASPRRAHTSQYHYGNQNERRNEDEDTHMEATSAQFDFFGVYDGHRGDQNPGHRENTVATSPAAIFAATNLHTYVAEYLNQGANPDEALVQAIAKTDKEYEKQFPRNVDGTTAVVALVDKTTHTVSLARLGDARWVVGNARGGVVAASKDQKPQDDAERLGAAYDPRIPEFGLFPCVTRGGHELGVSRAIGDRDFGDIISHEATAETLPIPAGGIAILACDGLWDSNIGNEEAVRMALEARRAGRTERQAAETIYGFADRQRVRDNVSVTVIYF